MFDLHKYDKVGMQSQRACLQNFGLLRPKAITNNDILLNAGQSNEFSFQSENGKYYGIAARTDLAGSDDVYMDSPDIDIPADGQFPWIQHPQFSSFSETDGEDDNQTIAHGNDKQDRTTVATIGEKAANAADHFLSPLRPENGLMTKRSAHLDGPVSSHDATVEANAGQMADYEYASTEFECDGNKYTSLTPNSKQ
jgi:hypothetical protein